MLSIFGKRYLLFAKFLCLERKGGVRNMSSHLDGNAFEWVESLVFHVWLGDQLLAPISPNSSWKLNLCPCCALVDFSNIALHFELPLLPWQQYLWVFVLIPVCLIWYGTSSSTPVWTRWLHIVDIVAVYCSISTGNPLVIAPYCLHMLIPGCAMFCHIKPHNILHRFFCCHPKSGLLSSNHVESRGETKRQWCVESEVGTKRTVDIQWSGT